MENAWVQYEPPLMTRACVAVWRAVIFWHGSNLTHRGTLWIKVKQPILFLTPNKILNMKSDIRPNRCQNDLFHKAEPLYPPLSLGAVFVFWVLEQLDFLQSLRPSVLCPFCLSFWLSEIWGHFHFSLLYSPLYIVPCIKKQRQNWHIWHLFFVLITTLWQPLWLSCMRYNLTPGDDRSHFLANIKPESSLFH